MDLDTANSIEVITVSTSSTPGSSGKKVVPLQIGYKKVPLLECSDIGKLRRPVRPIDRQRMRPWLMELLDLGNVFGLRWTNRHQGVFQISWRHASRLGWNLETDGDVFERWARHTGIYREGDPPEPKRWKANFRCALHSLHDVVELTSAVERKGRNACRTYRFLHSNDQQSIFRKKAKSRKVKDQPEKSYDNHSFEEPQVAPIDSASSEDGASESESDWSQEDKVIVQELNLKTEIPEEEYGLHHDHDYSALPDKTQKTIVLRQGIGSIVLHKEIFSAPDDGESDKNLLISNLDQLASAAMSSAGMDDSHRKRLDGLNQPIKIEQVEQSSTDSQTVKVFDIKLQSLLTSPMEHLRYMTRKRKTSKEETKLDSQTTNSAPKKGSKKKSFSLVSSSQNVSTLPPLSPTALVQRSGSPKILCRRSKRNSSKSEKCAETAESLNSTSSESTEPLMSSCLLLLEAATRLDNAEKNGRSGSQQSERSVREDTDVEMAETFETSCEGSIMVHRREEACEDKTPESKTHHFVVNQEPQKSSPVIKSSIIQNVLTEKSLITPEGKLILSEAKGLFSGSNIHSSAQPDAGANRKSKESVQIQQAKPNYIFVTRSTDTEQVSGDTVPEASAKSLLGNQHVILKKNLPVLKQSGDFPLVIRNAGPLQALIKIQEGGSLIKGSLERNINTSCGSLPKGHSLGDNNSQASLLQGNMYSLISPLNSSESALSPKVIVTSPIIANTLTPLSTVTNLVTSTPVLINTSYNIQTNTQGEGPGNTPTTVGKGQALVMYDLGKEPVKDQQVHMGPVTTARTPTAASTPSSSTPHSTSSSSSSSSSPAFITSKSTLWQLPKLLPSANSLKINIKHDQHQNERKVKLLPFCIRSKSGNKHSNSKQVLVLKAVSQDNPAKDLSHECDADHADSNTDRIATNDISLLYDSVSSSSVVLDSSLETNQVISDNLKQAHISTDTVKPLAELCKRYLSLMFSTLDNQSSESDDSDSVGDSLKLDQSQNNTSFTLECSDYESKDDLGEKLTDASDISTSEKNSGSANIDCDGQVLSHVSLLARDESHEQNKDSILTISSENIPLFASVELTASQEL